MIKICIAGTKGGSGKTTLTTNISTALQQKGYVVGVIDADPQGSTKKWVNKRQEDNLLVHHTTNITQSLGFFESKSMDIALIETAGFVNQTLKEAIKSAHWIIVPVRPTMADIEEVPTILKIITDTNPNVQVGVMLNAVSTNTMCKKNQLTDAIEVLKQVCGTSAHVLDSYLSQREAFVRAYSEGRGVCELTKTIFNQEVILDAKARNEINTLLEEIGLNK